MKQNSRYISKTRFSTNDLNNNNDKSRMKKQIMKTKNVIRTISSDNKQSRKKFKSKQKLNIEEEKNLKQSNEIIKSYNKKVNCSTNNLKQKKKINSLNRLVDDSKILLEEQNNILAQTNNLINSIEINNYEIGNIFKKNEKQNFCKCLEEYNPNLENILSNLKQNTKIVEFSNKINQKNENLKYKMQILSIDKNDDFRILETKLNSLISIFTNEMNSLQKFLYELGFENKFSEKITPENLTTDIIINYFNSLKNLIKEQKFKIEEKERQIKFLNKMKFEENKTSNINFTIKDNNKNLNINKEEKNNIENIKNSINNDRLKKIEELCIKNTYDIDSIKENYNISRINFEDFQRSKNIININNNNETNNNSDLGIQLEHNYTDSCFYPNIKESIPIKRGFDEINNNNMKEYISRTNESQPINKFI